MKDFRDLNVWTKAHKLTLDVYHATRTFPNDERFGLTSQIRRSASSVPANLAEGCGRGTDAELAQFAQVSMGSASETEYHLLLARDLGLLNDDEYTTLRAQVIEVKRMLASLIATLRGTRTSNGSAKRLTADR
jgi:four helix bundle protein